jgi:Gram-negative bacterial TonB protein C-terminal
MATRIAEYSLLGERPDERVRTARGIYASAQPPPGQKSPSRPMQFLVKRESTLLGAWRSWAVLCSRTNSLSFHGPIVFFRNARLSQFRLRPRSFSASVLFHCSMILLLVYLPRVLPAAESGSDRKSEIPLTEEIYFRVPLVDTAKPLPSRASEAALHPEARPDPVEPPASPLAQSDAPKTENTASYGSLTIVSKPVRPDNFHQTIIQPLSPPDLKIASDVKVPNIVLVLGKQPNIAKPTFDVKPSDSRPLRPNRQIASVAAPSLAPTQQNSTLPPAGAPDIAKPGFALNPTNSKPVVGRRQTASVAAPSVTPSEQNAVLPFSNTTEVARPRFVPAPSDSKPVEAKRQMASVQAPSVGTTQQDAALPGIPQGAAAGARLPIPMAAPSTPLARHSNGAGQGASPVSPAIAISEDRIDLVAIGINPSDPSSEVVLPPGNRSGEFTITPAGSSNGTAKISGGESNANPAKTLGASAHESSGGTGTKGAEGTLSIVGPSASGDGNGMLDPALGASLVFPVPSELLPKARQNHLVISTGPMGGGGLNLYGAMQCGRIYTVFLEMPKNNWTLQYCEKKADGTKPAPQSSSNVVHLETPLTPPDVQTRFDFERLPVPPQDAHKLIILKGIIREDGSVDQVQVYQGILPRMDEAARLALSQWKFKPALRQGKPVPLEILVGIPLTATTSP